MTAENWNEVRNIVQHELPTFMASSYGSAQSAWHEKNAAGVAPQAWPFDQAGKWAVPRRVQAKVGELENPILIAALQTKPETPVMTNERRMVRVLVVDPDEAVPTADALLFDSKEMFTDKTDQELFFEIGVGAFLATHNGKRVKIVDKTIKDRTQFLEPARIRDLKMLVITLAKF